MDSKNSADLHLQVDGIGHIRRPHVTAGHLQFSSAPIVYVVQLRYRDVKHHDISISLLGYDMNPKYIVMSCIQTSIYQPY